MKMKTQARQGDVFIINKKDANIQADTRSRLFGTAEGLAELARDQGRVVLAYGEVTGHAHVITDEGVVMSKIGNTEVYSLSVQRQATLTHEEHSAISIAPGENVVIHQKEYQQGQIQRVVD